MKEDMGIRLPDNAMGSMPAKVMAPVKVQDIPVKAKIHVKVKAG